MSLFLKRFNKVGKQYNSLEINKILCDRLPSIELKKQKQIGHIKFEDSCLNS